MAKTTSSLPGQLNPPVSTADPVFSSLFKPHFKPSATAEPEAPATAAFIKALGLQYHNEGGYLLRTDQDPLSSLNPRTPTGGMRSASSSAFYLITPQSPLGVFHRNKARIVHALHAGRARYVIIHPDERDSLGKVRIETFIVGHDVVNGELLQWVVEPNVWKSTILLPDEDGKKGSDGMLISETCVPAWEPDDHDFMTIEVMKELLAPEQVDELEWMIREEGP